MPVSVTLATLRNRVRFLGDFDNSRFGQPSQSVSDARLDEVINDALRATYDLFLDYRTEQFVVQQATTTTASISTVSLATNFYRLYQAEIADGSNYFPLHHINLREAWRFGNGSPNPRGLAFVHTANTLNFYPTPTVSSPLRIWYAPTFSSLLLTTDTFDGINGFERLAIARAIVDLKMREGMPAIEWVQKVKQYTDEVMADAGEADRGTPFLLSGMGSGGSGDDSDGWWM